MPRKPRLDIEGGTYHIINRGLERKAIFLDDGDRSDFLDRLGSTLKETNIQMLSFALVPNHFHLLVKRNKTNLSVLMRKLCAGYAGHFNKKHKRTGYLFQNRYKSILCQEGSYFLHLVRYINLNPLRAGLVRTLDELDNYPFAAHSAIVGKTRYNWFKPDSVLAHFASGEIKAKNLYQGFMRDGHGETVDLSGGGRRRSSYIEKLATDAPQPHDDRILGDDEFVQAILERSQVQVKPDKSCVPQIMEALCAELRLKPAEITGTSKTKALAKARAALAYRLATQAGIGPSEIGRVIGCTRSAASKMIARGGSDDYEDT